MGMIGWIFHQQVQVQLTQTAIETALVHNTIEVIGNLKKKGIGNDDN